MMYHHLKRFNILKNVSLIHDQMVYDFPIYMVHDFSTLNYYCYLNYATSPLKNKPHFSGTLTENKRVNFGENPRLIIESCKPLFMKRCTIYIGRLEDSKASR
jgi:hypothetical protein